MSVRRTFLLPLVPLYSMGLRVKNGLFARGVARVRSLGKPVISVGSLAAGGAGKTPVVLMLAELLSRHGVRVDVLSRGYGRGSDAIEQVDAGGAAERYGDEPMEMARAGVRVFVGAERFRAGMLAEVEGEVDVHLLDDGFQHRRLHRDLEIVLLTKADADDGWLPAGNLRESLRSLERADVVVLREEEEATLGAVVKERTRAEVWVVRRELVMPGIRLERPFVFCGIARPEGFLTMLRAAGSTPVGSAMVRDHHRYTSADAARLMKQARAAGADGFCTTAKDEVRLPAAMLRELERIGPVTVARLRVTLLDEEKAVSRMMRAAGG